MLWCLFPGNLTIKFSGFFVEVFQRGGTGGYVHTGEEGTGVMNSLINLSLGKTLENTTVLSFLQLPHLVF